MAGRESNDKSMLSPERLVFFSDAVIAIAMTVLAMELSLPDRVTPDLIDDQLLLMWPKYVGFALSFWIIGLYWMIHHNYCGYIRRHDNRLAFFNLLYLFFLVMIPFSTSMLGDYPEHPLPAAFYAGTIFFMSASLAAFWIHASRHHRLVDRDLDPALIRELTTRVVVSPLLFVVSIPVVMINWYAAVAIWVLSPLISRFVASWVHRSVVSERIVKSLQQ